DLHVDKTNSKLYVATCTSSLDIPTMNPGAPYYYDGTENGLTDMYFARFTLAGVMTWATYIGGSGDEWLAMSVNSAPDGDIALITLTGSVDMPCVNPGGSAFFDNSQNGSWDIYLCRLESTGQMSWSTYYGSPNNEHCQHNLTFDANGNIIMCGVSDGTAAPPTFNPGPPHYYDGVKDAMGTYCLIQFSTVGVMLWGTYWGGSGHDHLFGTVGKCIGVSNHSDIFVCGETTSLDLPTLNPGGGAYYNTTPGQGFVTKFNNDIVPPVVLPIQLLYWHCESTADGIVLRWQTATETDNDYFTIERTTDGANWEFLTTVPGAGTSSMMHEYKYVDNAPFTGNNYYRLSQTDFNGNKQSFNYTVCDYVGKNALMNVYSVSGQLLFSEYTNDYRNTLSKSGIAPGVYLIELVNGTDKITVKYMKTDQ
ncbi:MAG TPA: T9SS type A sorting domain-containing protein, partial [Bacteroidia bacterium]|nr:T9SS type A sorting domain-containing protein [Bacteroidia bacterium]